jgi:hypothetical protein
LWEYAFERIFKSSGRAVQKRQGISQVRERPSPKVPVFRFREPGRCRNHAMDQGPTGRQASNVSSWGCPGRGNETTTTVTEREEDKLFTRGVEGGSVVDRGAAMTKEAVDGGDQRSVQVASRCRRVRRGHRLQPKIKHRGEAEAQDIIQSLELGQSCRQIVGDGRHLHLLDEVDQGLRLFREMSSAERSSADGSAANNQTLMGDRDAGGQSESRDGRRHRGIQSARESFAFRLVEQHSVLPVLDLDLVERSKSIHRRTN